MKEKIDNLLSEDQELQKYLHWLQQKTIKENISFQPKENELIQESYKFYSNTDLTLSKIFYIGLDLEYNLNLNLNENRIYEVLLRLKARLPDEKSTSDEEFKEWWQENSQTWSVDFRNAMIKYQNIGRDWQFSESQKVLLEQYYRANQLLTQCLHHECYVSREVRQAIEETLLLPISEIEKHKKL